MAACLLNGICWTALVLFSPIEGQWAGGLWTLNGVVHDPSGAIINDAPVVVENEVTGERWETFTTDMGIYRVKVPVGRYRASVQMWHNGLLLEGHHEGVEVLPHYSTGLDFWLEIANENVTVESNAAGGTFKLADGSIGVGFHRPAETTPLVNGATFQSLLALVPGVVVTESVGTLAQFTVAGQRRFANRVTVDGVSGDLAVDVGGAGIDESGSGTLPAAATSGSLQTLVPFSAIDEIQIRTTNARAEHSQAPGAQTAIITRAGADTFKGAASVSARPQQLAAADYFRTISGEARRFSSADGTVSLGGPLRRGRLFYFAAAEAQRIDRPYAATVPVPSQSLRETAALGMRPILEAFPSPNGRELSGGLAEFSHAFPLSSSLGVMSVRTDATLGGHRLFARVNVGASRGDAVRTPGQQPDFSFRDTESTSTRTATIGWTATASATVNDLRVNVSTHSGALVASTAPYSDADPLPITDLIVPGSVEPWVRITAFPTTTGSGNLVSGRTGGSSQRQLQFVNTVTAVRRRHELQFGVDLTNVLAATPASTRYTYTFTNTAQLLQGSARLTIETRELARIVFRSLAAFAQDTYRATPRLTLQYGVRYSVNPAPVSRTELEPAMARFDALPSIELRPSGDPLWRTSWRNVAPHVGAAFQLGTVTGRETTVRAGWDLVYDELTSPGGSAFGSGAPYVSRRVLTPRLLPISVADIEQAAAPPDLVDRYAFADLRSPRTYRWQVGIDRALGRVQRISVAYVGTAARDLVYRAVYNPGGISTVYAFSNDASADYHGLLAEYARRLSRGVQASVAYTWSHAIDIDSGEGTGANLPQSVSVPRANRASADYDRRHVLRAAGTYQIPAPRMLAITGGLFEGWRLDAAATFRSGAPITVSGFAGASSYLVRPDVIADAPVWIDDATSPSGRRLDRGAFSLPTEVRQGTLGRNTFRASPLRQFDLALSRTTRLCAGLVMQVRIEAFNVFNMSNFGPLVGRYQRDDFGRPQESAADALGTGTLTAGGLIALQQVGGPRSVQIGARLAW